MADLFTHLHVHTEYSFLDGFSKVWDNASKSACDLIKRLKEVDQKFCAITDHGSTSGWARFDKACKKNDIAPIFGVEGYYCDDIAVKGMDEEQKLIATRGKTTAAEKKEAVKAWEKKLGLNKRAHFIVLAMNEEGIYEILKSQSIAATDGFYYRPRWDWNMIKEMKNCIFSSACAGGILNYFLNVETDDMRKYDEEIVSRAMGKAMKEAAKWKELLGDRFYIELMPLDWEQQSSYNLFAHQIAKDLDIPCILTNDSHYSYQPDWEAHDILLALQSSHKAVNKDVLNDPNRMRYSMRDLFIKTRQEVVNSFYKHNSMSDFPKAEVKKMVENTMVIAERCHHGIIKKKMIMPRIKLPDEFEKKEDHTKAQKEYLLHLVKLGWKRKIEPYVEKSKFKEYKERIQYEMGEILRQGFTPYFLLCHNLMKWVDEKGIARGPARGSSAGSLVAYLLDITMIDPIPHRLLFSRFIDPNRSDFPDVDMDFEDWRRREIVEYFIETYGRDNVAILGNNMTFKPKMALKDVARLYGVPIQETQELCNLVVERSGADSRLSFCLEDTFNQFDFAKKYLEKYPKVAKFSKQLEGKVKNQGVHAAGVIIADGDIRKYTSLRYDQKKKDYLVSTIDKHDAEDVGLLKMDILGLNTMTIIQEAKRLIKERHNVDIDLEDIVREVTYKDGEPEVLEEFANGHTTGIFQFNSPGLTRLVMQTKIEKFSEISDATALHRPGPIHCLCIGPNCKIRLPDREVGLNELIDKKFEVVVYDNKTKTLKTKQAKAFKTGKQKVYRVRTKSGKELICTEGERFSSDGNKYVELKYLSLGSKVYYI